MTKRPNSQKFIAQNRAPRVQIEYDVELYGADKRVELPFVMAVMSDLSGQPAKPLPPVAERKFVDVNIDNFDERMSAMQPRVAFNVPNTLTGEGQLPIEINFQKLDDFSPAAVARNVEPLRRLLAVRARLASLLTYMDGKSDAERLVTQLLQQPQSLAALVAENKPAADGGDASQAEGSR
ncbi:MAG TPA: type VI secretion system contractile sheath small subunit [Polyangiales bacterium]|jgi:type VI secretion system protein ImpB|nr:type VI secretion system contractile sheath small subunit [Polyangiales bacterium]